MPGAGLYRVGYDDATIRPDTARSRTSVPRVTWAKRSRPRSNERSDPVQRLIDGQASANETIRTPPTMPATTVERFGPRRVMITSVPEVSWIFAIFPHAKRGRIY